MKLLIFFLSFLFFFNSNAEDNKDSFYVSLRSDEVNMRTGPGNEYPIKYVYEIKEIPLKVLGEYDNWYKIRDKDKEEGWINKNLTTKKRTLIVINGTQIMYKKDDLKSSPVFRLEKNVIVKYEKCNREWCKIEIRDRNGWIQIKDVWGYEI